MAKKYYYEFRVSSKASWGGELTCPECVTEENVRAWYMFLSGKLRELLTPKSMETPEFKAALARLEEVRKLETAYEQHRLQESEARERRRSLERPKIDFIPRGLTVDYEEEYGKYLQQEVAFTPTCEEDFLYQFRLIRRWCKKSVPQLIEKGRPDAAYAVSIALCKVLPHFISRKELKRYLGNIKPTVKELIVDAFDGLTQSVKAWNNESKRQLANDFIAEQSKQYSDFKGVEEKLLSLIQSTPFIGEPTKVEREMNDEEIYAERQRRREEQLRLEAERDARSVIPLNHDYETRIFTYKNTDWECDTIWRMMLAESARIEGLALGGNYNDAAMLFMQLAKSMCRHFIKDEHYNLFDDMYSPEQVIGDLVRFFNKLSEDGKLPKETQDYLRIAWQEIHSTEASRSYGLLISYSFTF